MGAAQAPSEASVLPPPCWSLSLHPGTHRGTTRVPSGHCQHQPLQSCHPTSRAGVPAGCSSAGTERRRQNPIRNHHACTERTINANISFWTYKMECFSFPMTKNLKNEDYSPILNSVISFLSSSLEERNGGKKRTKFKTLSTTKCECLLLKPSRKKNLLACSLINFSSQLLHLTEVSPQSPWEAWPESLSLPHPQHCLH